MDAGAAVTASTPRRRPSGDAPHAAPRVERHLPPANRAGRAAEHARWRRSPSASCRRGRSRRGPARRPALRGPTRSAAGGVDPRDAAAAGADRVHVDHRHAQRVAADRALAERRAACRRGPAPMSLLVPPMSSETKSRTPERSPANRRPDHAAGRAREEQGDRPLRGPRRRGDAAARVHDQRHARGRRCPRSVRSSRAR